MVNPLIAFSQIRRFYPLGSPALQMVAIGFIIGILQDSAGTALDSSTDVLFTAACMARDKA